MITNQQSSLQRLEGASYFFTIAMYSHAKANQAFSPSQSTKQKFVDNGYDDVLMGHFTYCVTTLIGKSSIHTANKDASSNT